MHTYTHTHTKHMCRRWVWFQRTSAGSFKVECYQSFRSNWLSGCLNRWDAIRYDTMRWDEMRRDEMTTGWNHTKWKCIRLNAERQKSKNHQRSWTLTGLGPSQIAIYKTKQRKNRKNRIKDVHERKNNKKQKTNGEEAILITGCKTPLLIHDNYELVVVTLPWRIRNRNRKRNSYSNSKRKSERGFKQHNIWAPFFIGAQHGRTAKMPH